MELLGYLVLFIKIGFVLGAVLTLAAYLVLIERRLLGFFQNRLGPNRVGKFGLLQPLADGIKLLLKEDVILDGADRILFQIAPFIVAATALLMLAVIPFGPEISLFGRQIPMVITDINIGLLYVFALSSLSVYGVALGGWASNSKFALLGGIRGAAQMISYELALGLSIVPIVMLTQSFSLVEIVNAQENYPFILIQPVSFIIFFISAMAESKRIPFDLPEAETELGAGYHTEYSGMRFGLYFLGEYVHMQVLGALIAVLYLGGWRGPILPALVWFPIKIIVVCLVMVWIRATLPRLRYDQLMELGWKVLIPAALINILVTGLFIL
jgi:NADH-quinone oxidoreductase subunit H